VRRAPTVTPAATTANSVSTHSTATNATPRAEALPAGGERAPMFLTAPPLLVHSLTLARVPRAGAPSSPAMRLALFFRAFRGPRRRRPSFGSRGPPD
jgi:hypothetical protein